MKSLNTWKAVVVFCLACFVVTAVSGCSIAEWQVKNMVNSEIKDLTESLGGLSAEDVEVPLNTSTDAMMFMSTLYEKAKAEVESVELSEDESTATVTIGVTSPDLVECAKMLTSKASELQASDEIIDMDKQARLDRASQDLYESLEASPERTVEAQVEFEQKDGEWIAADDIDQAVRKAIISDADAEALTDAFNGYVWQFDDMNASEIVEKLKADGMPIGEIEAYDESSDPNELLGRPDEYTSKATWWDERIEDPYDLAHVGGTLDNEMGGTVEVFDNVEDCKTRAEYLDAVTSTGLGKMYSYRFGCVLMRVTYDLEPSEAAEYEAAFKAMEN